MALGVANVWLPVRDTDRAVDFYENTLGLSLAKRDGEWAERWKPTSCVSG